MKAVTPILSHSSLLLIGLLAVSLIIVSLSNSFSSTESDLIRTELNYIAESAKDKIIEIYSLANQSSEYFNSSFGLFSSSSNSILSKKLKTRPNEDRLLNFASSRVCFKNKHVQA